jgi:hypothetical protein
MTAAVRRQAVEVLSARGEMLLVMRAAMAVVVAVWMYVALTAGSAVASKGPRNLLPFQRLVADRPFDEQRMFRELQEGMLEAERTRVDTGRWPMPDALAADGVPPFAADPTRKVSYSWTLIVDGVTANYLGVPAPGRGAPAWLVLLQEPAPGVPPDQAFEDEEHHRLPNGVMLHISNWVRAEPVAGVVRLVRMPQAEGWTQLYAVGPSATPVSPLQVPPALNSPTK